MNFTVSERTWFQAQLKEARPERQTPLEESYLEELRVVPWINPEQLFLFKYGLIPQMKLQSIRAYQRRGFVVLDPDKRTTTIKELGEDWLVLQTLSEMKDFPLLQEINQKEGFRVVFGDEIDALPSFWVQCTEESANGLQNAFEEKKMPYEISRYCEPEKNLWHFEDLLEVREESEKKLLKSRLFLEKEPPAVDRGSGLVDDAVKELKEENIRLTLQLEGFKSQLGDLCIIHDIPLRVALEIKDGHLEYRIAYDGEE